MYNFYPASDEEGIVYGASRPGYPSKVVYPEAVGEWIVFMKRNGIRRVCCLLDDSQLCYYPGGSLIKRYQLEFGTQKVINPGLEDFKRIDSAKLYDEILPFLKDADLSGEKVVVHCSAGLGRTGKVILAWLVHGRRMAFDAALQAASIHRSPLESASVRELKALLELL